MALQGALMIGGASRRMGRPKSLIPLGDTTWGDYLCGLLATVTGSPAVIVGAGSIGDRDPQFQRISDRAQGAGPLAGLLGLYDAFPQTDFLVLATDMPLMRPDALRWLLQQAEDARKPVVWPRRPERENGEPLAAWYGADARVLLEQAWSQGERSLMRSAPLSARHQPLIDDIYLPCFSSFNHPEDLTRLLDDARPGGGSGGADRGL